MKTKTNELDCPYCGSLVQHILSVSDGYDWFNITLQKALIVDTCLKTFVNHADTMSPEEIVSLAKKLNNEIYSQVISGVLHNNGNKVR